MKTPYALPVWVLAGLLLTAFILADAGCASKPKVDWNQRIGHFTFDDAVHELGPPFSSIKLQDSSTVAEWFLKPGSSFSFGVGVGSYGSSGGVGVGHSVTTPTPGHYLRLTFGPDGQLQRWEKVRH